ncbi:MAG: hypothetical protein JNN30_15490 [Rhodanobacteraceae bacterium]|nr:hypothetical protein [Rhodanobacteraceae bacterium]
MSTEAQTPLRPERPLTVGIDPARIAARVLPMRRALLHELRWRRPDLDRRRIVIAVAIVLLVHLLLVLLVRDGMRLKPLADDRSDVLRVTLIDAAPPVPSPPARVYELPTLSVSAPIDGVAHNSPASARRRQNVPQAQAPAPSRGEADGVVSTPAAPSLYNPDGSLRVTPALPPQEVPDRLTRDKLAAKELSQRGHNIVRCKRTRFADAYTPDESLGERAARKYGVYIGLYNPAVAQKAAERAAEARINCDWEG